MNRKIYYTPRNKELKQRAMGLVSCFKKEPVQKIVRTFIIDVIILTVNCMAAWHNIKTCQDDYDVIYALGLREKEELAGEDKEMDDVIRLAWEKKQEEIRAQL
ncbi:hypothetical protein LCGC14_1353310 [marine sediment metagenome]|uniref:Uncharacterized protein n=1 Tax=marine sediment metagenome TaxID=412755 RepID=A0A0F9MQV9_9ZZZZ|nr:hypothetical protein [Candidatus Aminicenantes bacterium]